MISKFVTICDGCGSSVEGTEPQGWSYVSVQRYTTHGSWGFHFCQNCIKEESREETKNSLRKLFERTFFKRG